MPTVLEKIQSIDFKVNNLIDVINKLKNTNLELENFNRELNSGLNGLKQQLLTKESEIAQLNDKIKVLKLARSIQGDVSDDSQRDVKLKINEIIREVDKCIGLLNK